jgi:hypothetical protein
MHFLAKSFSADSQVISPAGKAITAFRSGKTQIFNWVDGVIL